MKADLVKFLSQLGTGKQVGRKTTQPQGDSAPRSKPIAASPWRDEAIVYLCTHTTCECGATSSQTNPVVMLKRWSPRKGFHCEPVALAHGGPLTHTLPTRIEHREVPLDNCHICLSLDPLNSKPTNPYKQLSLEL